MKEKYNFKIDLNNSTISVEVSPSIFPPAVILHAAYHFIEEANVIVKEGGGSDEKNKIIVTFIPKRDSIKESDLDELGYEFNIQLISSFVEEEESRKHAGVRDAMMRAAFSPPQIQRGPRPIPPSYPPPGPPPSQTQK